ncbi:MAG: M23 family metallopeptidase [Proteobacteria bacterium]|nr:M23 family metallopeptidase [Pseudomonadota bacterium]
MLPRLPLIALTAGLALAAPARPEAEPAPPRLALPLACQPGRDCFVQNYPDHGDGSAARDYRCGGQSYTGHDGTDLRLPSLAAMRRGVAVLAAAAGTVRVVRDGVEDRLLESAADRAALAGRECGNGVVIDHPGGWQTQYCHLARGSVAVAAGQAVAAGARLGLVGLSGDTQFPHVHLSLRHGSRKVDPFAPDLAPGRCGPGGGAALWGPAAALALTYRPAVALNAGFAAEPPELPDIEADKVMAPEPDPAALVFYGRAIGLEAGDRLVARILAPDGTILADSTFSLQRATQQAMARAGRRRPQGGWAPGPYRGSFTVLRGGVAVAARSLVLMLKPGTAAPVSPPAGRIPG